MHLFKAWNQHGVCHATVCATADEAAVALGKYPEYADNADTAWRTDTKELWLAPGAVFVRDYGTANLSWVRAPMPEQMPC